MSYQFGGMGHPVGRAPDASARNPAFGNMNPSNGPFRETVSQLYHLSESQTVQVRIRTNCWVVGLVVGTLQFFKSIAGWGYEIEYQVPSGGSFRSLRGPFRQEDIRPEYCN
ncbi:hypothetical protein PLICRDRAFT_29141 [Plicaturopsis crispa FD-325 SS-3]|nr:hypothetical protein PLICRDRAFT_29141 [Plicaturopsis crispa FD-325 SS-3]